VADVALDQNWAEARESPTIGAGGCSGPAA
jgi:hypothetical protein